MRSRVVQIVIALTALLATSVHLRGQGLVQAANSGPGLNAPITNGVTGQLVSGSGFLAQLYGGAPSTVEADLVALGSPTPFFTGALAGYFYGGVATNSFVLPGATAAFQLRAWSGPFTSWQAAYQAAQTDPDVLIGTSLVFNNATGISSPAALTGLNSFTVTPFMAVPEPASMALWGLGLVVFLLRRHLKA